jgi:hypothetical protein
MGGLTREAEDLIIILKTTKYTHLPLQKSQRIFPKIFQLRSKKYLLTGD